MIYKSNKLQIYILLFTNYIMIQIYQINTTLTNFVVYIYYVIGYLNKCQYHEKKLKKLLNLRKIFIK